MTHPETEHSTTPTGAGISRRSLARGAAWAAPAVAFAAAAPSIAASIIKVPGINGWVLNTTTGRGNCKYHLEVNSARRGTGPDGAPYGLYIYDVEPSNVITNARMTYWIIGNQHATWANYDNHSPCWSYQGRGTPQEKADGRIYTPYTWTYTCPIDPANVSPDGRLYLGHFHVLASFTQPSNRCNNVTFWTQRFITIDPDGPGPQPAEVQTFERRNGTDGPFTGRSRQAEPQSTTPEGDESSEPTTASS